MSGKKRRRRAPSATPWDDAPERDLGPAQLAVMRSSRSIYDFRHHDFEGDAKSSADPSMEFIPVSIHDVNQATGLFNVFGAEKADDSTGNFTTSPAGSGPAAGTYVGRYARGTGRRRPPVLMRQHEAGHL